MFRSYSDHLQGAHMFLVKDDLNKIETCWSVFKCFNVITLD